jgi:dihydroflavonol-4-reductase
VSESEPHYLVTGATGFLGRHVIGAIREKHPDARLVTLVREPAHPSIATLEYLKGVELITGSPVEAGEWRNDARLGNLDGIFHLAAEVKHTREHVESMMRFNVEATTTMVRLAAEEKCRMVFVSTSGTVACSPNADYSPDENAPYCYPVVRAWPYYVSKIEAEKESAALAKELGVELVTIRPPVMLGPGDHRFRSVNNVMRVLDGRLPFVLTGGINFADIRDAAQAIVTAMTHPSPRPVYHLPGTSSSLDGFFRRVARVAGIKASWRVLPARVVLALARINHFAGHRVHLLPDPVLIEMASRHWGLSSRFASADLMYSCRDPDETLADTVDWIRAANAGTKRLI